MKPVLSFVIAALAILTTAQGLACSAFLVEGSPHTLVAKNLDYFGGHGLILVNKRNVAKQAAFLPQAQALAWTSRYASLTVTGGAQEFPWEGVNEAGVSVNTLQLRTSVAPPADARPGISNIQWVQYILDTAASVDEVVAEAQGIRISGTTIIHYFVCDKTPKCAVLEYLAGKLVVHEDAALPYAALTNNSYDDSLATLENMQAQGYPYMSAGAWSMESLARFARAAYWSKNYVSSGEDPESYAFAGLYNLAQDVPATATSPGWRTYWSLALDLSIPTIAWRTAAHPGIKVATLAAFSDLDCHNEGTLALDLDQSTIATGAAESLFRPLAGAINAASLRTLNDELPGNEKLSAAEVQTIETYPSTLRCTD